MGRWTQNTNQGENKTENVRIAGGKFQLQTFSFILDFLLWDTAEINIIQKKKTIFDDEIDWKDSTFQDHWVDSLV